MKRPIQNLKFTILLAILIFALNTATAAERVNTKIDPARLQEVEAWLFNAKVEVQRGFDFANTSPVEIQEAALRATIDRILESSRGKNEFLMRNVLHRAVLVHNTLLKVPTTDPKRNAAARRILKESLKMAADLHETDLALIKNADNYQNARYLRPVEFAILGLDWSEYILRISYLLPTAESRLEVLTDAVGILYNDLLDDSQYNRLLAPIAQNIALFNSMQPTTLNTSIEKLNRTRDVRQFLEREVNLGRELTKGTSSLLKTDVVTRAPNPESLQKSRREVETEIDHYYALYDFTKTNKNCAKDYHEGQVIKKNQNWHIKCLHKHNLGKQYHVQFISDCADGYIKTERFNGDANTDHYDLCIKLK